MPAEHAAIAFTHTVTRNDNHLILDGTGTRERGRHVLADEGQQVEVSRSVAPILPVGLHGEHADRLAIGLQRDAKPLDRERTNFLDLTLCDQLTAALRVPELRNAVPQEVRG